MEIATNKNTEVAAKEEPKSIVERFDKVTILQSDRFKRYRDILDTVLNPGQLYGADEVDKVLSDALTHRVQKSVNE